MQNSGRCDGDADPHAAGENLSQAPQAVLAGVRAHGEWNFAGVAGLRAFGGEAVIDGGVSFPSVLPVNDFVGQMVKKMSEKKLDQTAPIDFLCRSGVRGQAAAIAMTQAGYANCFNIEGGFEGPLDAEGHRGTQSGAKATGVSRTLS